jgi:hypothetical protein
VVTFRTVTIGVPFSRQYYAQRFGLVAWTYGRQLDLGSLRAGGSW